MQYIIFDNIKALRQKHYKNQKVIAAKLGVSIAAYSKIETGKVDLSYSRIKQIADLYKISPCSPLPGEEFVMISRKHDELDIRVADLQSDVAGLQAKLINAYEENKALKHQIDNL